MKVYNHYQRNIFTIGPHFLGFLFILVGLFALASTWVISSATPIGKSILVGSSFIIIGFITVLSYSGTLIDFTNKRMMSYYSLVGILFGKWQKLEDIKLVKVVAENFQATRGSNGIHPSTGGNVSVYKVILYSKNPTPVLSLIFLNKESSLNDAKLLAENLNAMLNVNMTEHNS